MADTVKCALFVDYDSIYRRLAGANPDAAGALAQKVGAWVGGIESGSLVAPAGEGVRRRILIRRCYASPERLGAGRAAFVASGFEVVDCPIQEGRDRNSADIHIVLDTIDALEHPAGYEEFVLLSADADLTPVLLRLRAHARTTLIYANEATAATYRAIADGMIEEAALVGLLARDEAAIAAAATAAREKPAEAPAPAAARAAAEGAPSPQAADRNQIEALARKVHAATSVPLFSPRTYADLFRHIAQEIAEQGYHFQHTAENVTEKLVAAGRNVNRRQVLFVVKGLALKGHVFSVTDTPERLAEVFREQVLYLIGNSDLKLDDAETALLPSWIVGRVTTTQAAAEPPAAKAPPKRKPPAKPVAPVAPATPAAPPAPARAAPLREASPPPAAEAAARPAPRREPPVPAPKPAPPPAAPIEDEEAPRPAARKLDEIRAAAAARLAAIGRQANAAKPAPARPAAPAKPEAARAPEPKPAEPAKPARTRAPAAEENKDALESSILAAIAQAVDVLVEDSGAAAAPRREEEPPASPPPPEAEAAPAADGDAEEPVQSEGGDSDDIGDEIQRIIASYSRARNQGESR